MIKIDFVSLSLFFGTFLLLSALFPASQLLKFTRSLQIRWAWALLSILIVGFAAGYLFLIFAIPRNLDPILLVVISSIMVMGAIFVLSVTYLSERTARDIVRLAELERDVIVDPLTGIYNRRYFKERFAIEKERCARTGKAFSLIIADLDHFKSINDKYGHAAGDHVLNVAAARLSDVIRSSDILARFGGEEFVVLAPHTDGLEAVHLGERLKRAMESTDITIPGTGQTRVTASFGVAESQIGEESDALFARADAALYDAKEAGRNCVLLAKKNLQV